MTTENDFLPFAVGGGANVISQATYAADTALLSGGFQSGIADSNQLNKVWRQSSIIAAMIAQFIVNESGQPAIDDGTIATLLTNFEAAITATAGGVKLLEGLSGDLTFSSPDSSINIGTSGSVITLGSSLFSTQHDVTGSRSVGVVYTNSTGKPMFVTVNFVPSAGNQVTAHSVIGTLPGPLFSSDNAYGTVQNCLTILVPNGVSYEVIIDSGAYSIPSHGWVETY